MATTNGFNGGEKTTGESIGKKGDGRPGPAQGTPANGASDTLPYDRSFSQVDCDPKNQTPIPLSRSEIRVLAQQHLDCVHGHKAFVKTGGSVSSTDFCRAAYHEARFTELSELLGENDRQYLRALREATEKHLESLRDPEELGQE